LIAEVNRYKEEEEEEEEEKKTRKSENRDCFVRVSI